MRGVFRSADEPAWGRPHVRGVFKRANEPAWGRLHVQGVFRGVDEHAGGLKKMAEDVPVIRKKNK